MDNEQTNLTNTGPIIPDYISLLDLYKIYKAYLEHENDLLSQRTTWLVTSQSFFVAAYTFFAKLLGDLKPEFTAIFPIGELTPLLKHSIVILPLAGFVLLPVMGTLVAIFAYHSIYCACIAQHTIAKKWASVKNAYNPNNLLPEIAGGGNTFATKGGSTFAVIAPIILICFWLGLLVASTTYLKPGPYLNIGLGLIASLGIFAFIAIFRARLHKDRKS